MRSFSPGEHDRAYSSIKICVKSRTLVQGVRFSSSDRPRSTANFLFAQSWTGKPRKCLPWVRFPFRLENFLLKMNEKPLVLLYSAVSRLQGFISHSPPYSEKSVTRFYKHFILFFRSSAQERIPHSERIDFLEICCLSRRKSSAAACEGNYLSVILYSILSSRTAPLLLGRRSLTLMLPAEISGYFAISEGIASLTE